MKLFPLLFSLIAPVLSTIPNIVSWNIGLEEQFANERVDGIIKMINTTTSDVVCLSEIWGGPHRIRQFHEQLKDVYPYHYMIADPNYIDRIDLGPYSPACSQEDEDVIDPALPELFDCLDEVEVMDCMAVRLGSRLDISQRGPCWACLIEMTYKIYSKQPYHLSMCFYPQLWREGANRTMEANMNKDELNQPWEQTLGLMVFSNKELKNVSHHFMPTAVVPRGYISGIYDETLVVCTHLTVPNVPYPYPPITTHPELINWERENLLHAKIITDYSLSMLDSVDYVVIVGDFNHGREIQEHNVVAVNVEAYDYIDVNFTDNYRGECTVCEDNIVLKTLPQKVFDTIWTYGFTYDATKRVFDKKYYINVNGECILMQLSDHYGVSGNFNNNTIVRDISVVCDGYLNSADDSVSIYGAVIATMMLVAYMNF